MKVCHFSAMIALLNLAIMTPSRRRRRRCFQRREKKGKTNSDSSPSDTLANANKSAQRITTSVLSFRSNHSFRDETETFDDCCCCFFFGAGRSDTAPPTHGGVLS